MWSLKPQHTGTISRSYSESKRKGPGGKIDQRQKLGNLLSLQVPLGTRCLLKEGQDQRHKATMAGSQAPKVGDLLGNIGMRGTF